MLEQIVAEFKWLYPEKHYVTCLNGTLIFLYLCRHYPFLLKTSVVNLGLDIVGMLILLFKISSKNRTWQSEQMPRRMF
jgi:hypothetical protein